MRARPVLRSAELDGRYLLQTAHATLMRFQRQPRDLTQFVKQLHVYHGHDFGKTRIQEVYLVENDWYHSAARVKVMKT